MNKIIKTRIHLTEKRNGPFFFELENNILTASEYKYPNIKVLSYE